MCREVTQISRESLAEFDGLLHPSQAAPLAKTVLQKQVKSHPGPVKRHLPRSELGCGTDDDCKRVTAYLVTVGKCPGHNSRSVAAKVCRGGHRMSPAFGICLACGGIEHAFHDEYIMQAGSDSEAEN